MPSFSLSLPTVALTFLMLLPGCSRQKHDPPKPKQENLVNSPPALEAQLAQEPKKDREAFLARPPAEQKIMTTEWQRREQLLKQFTPTERTIISALSQPDSDDFFRIPPDDKAAQERFLTESISAYMNRLDACLVNTHRRFGPEVEADFPSRPAASYTPPEQVLIQHLTPEESRRFFSTSSDKQESFLSDHLKHQLEQLLSCETHSNRRLGEP
jgi:hypothetical protein